MVSSLGILLVQPAVILLTPAPMLWNRVKVFCEEVRGRAHAWLNLQYLMYASVYLVIVVSPMSSILWVHEPDVRGAKGLFGEFTEYASNGHCLLEYLAVSFASVFI